MKTAGMVLRLVQGFGYLFTGEQCKGLSGSIAIGGCVMVKKGESTLAEMRSECSNKGELLGGAYVLDDCGIDEKYGGLS